MAFPWLFPISSDCNTDTFRISKIGTLQYYWTKLYNKDNRFRLDILYILAACNAREHLSSIEIAMLIQKSENNAGGEAGESVSSNHLRNLSKNPDLIQGSYMFIQNIRGTCTYWKDKLYDLLCMFKFLVPPDIFYVKL